MPGCPGSTTGFGRSVGNDVDATEIAEPKTIAKITLTVTRGVAAGWLAGIPQVIVTQIAGKLGGDRSRADIGPRFIERSAQHTGRKLSPLVQWLIAAVFHFEYAAGWGAAYAVVLEQVGRRRISPLLGGAALGAVVYGAAFSNLGAATRTGAERPVERRRPLERALDWSAALSFALTTAYAYDWLRRQW